MRIGSGKDSFGGRIYVYLAMLLCVSSSWLGCSGEGPEVSSGSSSASGTTSTEGAGGSGGSGTGGLGGAGGSGGAGGAEECGPTQQLCGKTCANTMVDPANCGACGVSCALGALCSAGACAYDPITYVKASNTGKGDNFGTAIAISADGNTVAIGAYGEGSNAAGINGDQADNTAFGFGAVYVFTRSGMVWSQQAYIKASNPGANDYFGNSVSLSADGNTLTVGADGEDSNATGINGNQADNSADHAGAVYVFTRSGTAWSQQAYLKGSNTAAGDAFGTSVSLSGDGNTLAVGGSGEDSSATGVNGNQADNSAIGAGAVYVFTRSGTVWSQQAYIKASNPGADDVFGFSVALSADSNTLAVGANGEDSKATGINGNQADDSAGQAGAVYVFTRSGTAWSQQAYVKSSNPHESDYFGFSVALSADGNTLTSGADGEDSNATGINGNQADTSASQAGAVYVFTRSGAAWSQQAYIKASNTGAFDDFGLNVSLSVDGNTLAVGAAAEDSNATGINGDQADNSALSAGAVYVFTRSGTVWSQQAYIKASNTGEGDFFGRRISLSGDGNTLAASSVTEGSNATGINGNQADNSVNYAGAVYIY